MSKKKGRRRGRDDANPPRVPRQTVRRERTIRWTIVPGEQPEVEITFSKTSEPK